jgi:hypothetical protein
MQANTVEDVQAQEQLLLEANEKIERLKCAADMLVGAEFLRWEQHELIEEELRDEEASGDEERREPGWLKAKKATEQFRRAARTHAAIETADHFENSDLDTFHYQCQMWLNGETPFHWPLEFPEVFLKRGGFDAFVCNPPFMGGTKLEPAFGRNYRELLVNQIGKGIRGVRGTADLCAYFFLRACTLLGRTGCLGMLATNTISEGDTREVGLENLLSTGATIYRGVKSKKWPGVANLEVASVWIVNGTWRGIFSLNEQNVARINALLEVPGTVTGKPFRLKANEDKCIEGAKSLGMGFVLEQSEAAHLLSNYSKNAEVVFPFLTGQDLNSTPDQSATRWAIYFADMPLERQAASDGKPCASDYPDCLRIVEERVKPERMAYPPDSSWNRSIRERWWQFGLPRPALLKAIHGLKRVLVRSAVSNINSIAFSSTSVVFSHVTKVFPFDDFGTFALLQSCFHDVWLSQYASSMRTDIRYTPESCFDTFAFPLSESTLQEVGGRYHEHRRQVMLSRQEGLTKTYNRFHDPDETSADILKLRQLHVEMDQTVAAPYG